MGKTVNQRLRRVDQRISNIDRRLGFLEGQLYFKPAGTTDWTIVDTFSHIDNGISPQNITTGEQISAHRFTVKVNRDWIDAHIGEYGAWGLQQSSTDPILYVEKESETVQDSDTFGTMTFRISQNISVPLN
jgi:hypothetical protein